MKAGRSAEMGSPIRWWALAFLFFWLAGISVAAAKADSCGDSKATETGCAGMQGACCCDDASSAPEQPLNALPVVTQQWFRMELPVTDVSETLSDATTSAVEIPGRRSDEFQIPPELRLGSALWSHAPPTRVA